MDISVCHRTVHPPVYNLKNFQAYSVTFSSKIILMDLLSVDLLQLYLNLSGLSALGAMHFMYFYLLWEISLSVTCWETVSIKASFNRHFLSSYTVPVLGLGHAMFMELNKTKQLLSKQGIIFCGYIGCVFAFLPSFFPSSFFPPFLLFSSNR